MNPDDAILLLCPDEDRPTKVEESIHMIGQ
jgi:hypothetical protein